MRLPSVLGAVVVLLALTLAVVLIENRNAEPTALPPPAPPFTLPGTTSGPQVPVSLVPTGETTETTETTDEITTPETPREETTETTERPTATPIPRPTPVTGHFHVLSSYSDGFIGEVLLENHTTAAQDWTVQLAYPGTLRTSWLESLPQPTFKRNGDLFTWISAIPLPAGATARMRFHFNGTDTPTSCTVNSSPCR